MYYFEKKKIESLIEKMALSNINGFYPSVIKKQLNIEPNKYVPILEELVNENVLQKSYILRNIENPNETKEFSVSELPLGKYYDDFHFGEEFLVTEDDVVVLYKFSSEFKDELKKKEMIYH